MNLRFYPIQKLKKQILEIVGKYLDLNSYRVFFFGGRVTKKNERSDIDVGIEGPNPVSLQVLSKIEEEIDEIPTLYTIEIVDFKRTSSDFYKVAKEKIEPIYD